MQGDFFNKISESLSMERLESYGTRDHANGCTILARYLWNMSVCESLYSPLQLCEIGLRNALHHYLTDRYGEHWYDNGTFQLTSYGREEVRKARAKLVREKKPQSPGAIVANLQFGFWTHLFQPFYEDHNGFLPKGIKKIFPNLPKSQHNRKTIKHDLDTIRELRNEVFHHERIIHWIDLPQQHQLMVSVTGWISPELKEMAEALDRFTMIHSAGIEPWKEKIRSHWPADGGGEK